MKEWQRSNAQLFAQPSSIRFVRQRNESPVIQVFEPVKSPSEHLVEAIAIVGGIVIAASIAVTLWLK